MLTMIHYVLAFTAVPRPPVAGTSAPVRLTAPVASAFGRREFTFGAASLVAAICEQPRAALAVGDVKTVVVAGATGQTGRRCLERLAKMGGVEAIGGVRNLEKVLAERKIEMIQQGAAIGASGAVELRQLNVEKGVAELTAQLKGVDGLVIAVGFNGLPGRTGNPFKQDVAAHAVDNLGTVNLIDAAKAAGVTKVVLVSSILTDAAQWGQLGSRAYVLTNLWGRVLEEKLMAEKHLRASGLDWTIVRASGLKAGRPTGALFVSAENTVQTGQISRDLVASVSVAALFDAKASNKVVEIVERNVEYGNAKTGIFDGL